MTFCPNLIRLLPALCFPLTAPLKPSCTHLLFLSVLFLTFAGNKTPARTDCAPQNSNGFDTTRSAGAVLLQSK